VTAGLTVPPAVTGVPARPVLARGVMVAGGAAACVAAARFPSHVRHSQFSAPGLSAQHRHPIPQVVL